MIRLIFTIKVLCVASCIVSSESHPREEGPPSALRIPYPERVLNSVLGRLERSRQERMESAPAADEMDFKENTPIRSQLIDILYEQTLPEYTESLESALERGLRQLVAQKHYPICHLERKIRRLNTEDYEYRPAYYEEVKCATQRDERHVPSEICSSLGFSCIQWNKTIHLTRRRYDSDCWETRTMVIPSGCECMWPVQQLGELKYHV